MFNSVFERRCPELSLGASSNSKLRLKLRSGLRLGPSKALCLALCLAAALLFIVCAFSKAHAFDPGVLLSSPKKQAAAASGKQTTPQPPAPPAPPQPPAPHIPETAKPGLPLPTTQQPVKSGQAPQSGALKQNANPHSQPQPGLYSTGHVGASSPLDGFWFSMTPKGAITLGLKNSVFMLASSTQQFYGQGTFQVQGQQIFCTTPNGQKQVYSFHYNGQNLTLQDAQTGMLIIYQRIPNTKTLSTLGLIP